MPDFLERRLRAQARKKGFKGERADRYVYGAMNDMGAMHGSEITAKGREMERKHERDTMKNAPHRIREIRIEVHRGAGNKVTGHTVHHHMMPSRSPKSPSGAFLEETHHSFPFGADGESSTHGHISDHIAQHLGLSNAGMEQEESDAEEEAEEKVSPGIHRKVARMTSK